MLFSPLRKSAVLMLFQWLFLTCFSYLLEKQRFSPGGGTYIVMKTTYIPRKYVSEILHMSYLFVWRYLDVKNQGGIREVEQVARSSYRMVDERWFPGIALSNCLRLGSAAWYCFPTLSQSHRENLQFLRKCCGSPWKIINLAKMLRITVKRNWGHREICGGSPWKSTLLAELLFIYRFGGL